MYATIYSTLNNHINKLNTISIKVNINCKNTEILSFRQLNNNESEWRL